MSKLSIITFLMKIYNHLSSLIKNLDIKELVKMKIHLYFFTVKHLDAMRFIKLTRANIKIKIT